MSEERQYVSNFVFPSGETYYVKDTKAREDIEELKEHGAGQPGKSAYEIAVEEGFIGTEEEWLASLQGATGGIDAEFNNNTGVLTIIPGVSLTVTVADITGGHRVTITDATHPQGQSFAVLDGDVTGAVLYDETQTLTDAQKNTACGNIGAIGQLEYDAIQQSLSALDADISLKADEADLPTKVSDLENDTGYITASQVPAAPVQSVNGKTGSVTVNEVPDASGASVGQVLSKTANGLGWTTPSGGGGGSSDAVLYTAQTLTDAQKAQARTNVGAGTYSKPSGGIPASDLAAGVIPDISGKANAADVYTKAEVDQKLVGAMDYKGTKATVSALPTSGNETGDVWHITADGSEWAWNGSAWEELGTAVDLSGYRTASAQDTIDAAQDAAIAAKYTKPSTGIPKTDLASDVKASLGKADTALQEHQSLASYRTASAQDTIDAAQDAAIAAKYTKPNGGIPKSDLAAAVKTSLGKADTALQSAPVTSVNTKTGAVVLSASDVGALPSSTSIPAKASDLTNDIGYQTEQDVQAAISGVRQIPTFPSIADIAELWHSVSKLPSGAWEDYAWHQCPEAVRNYIANVDYNGVAYTESSIGTYAPTPAVPATNTKPIGQTVDGVTFYNIRPNSNAPYATANKSGVLNPIDQVRWIKSATGNMRDLGGWACDGGKVKYGLLYRSGELNTADEDLFICQLGITVECDLTADGTPAFPGKMRFIGHTSYAMYSLANTEAWRVNLRGIFDAVCAGESVVFHCSMGADRTGTLACILEGLLGVSQSDIDKDYELTSFFAERARNGNYQGGTTDWAHLIAQILALSGETFREKCETFVLSLGFTEDEINAYRSAMIDGKPEDSVEPTQTNLFDPNDTDVLLRGRVNSSGAAVAYADGQLVTGFIPAAVGDVFRIETDKTLETNNYTGTFATYTSEKGYIWQNGHANQDVWTLEDDGLKGVCTVLSNIGGHDQSATAYVRFCIAYTDIANIKIYKL